ncbi:MAG: hypothetical protein K1Y36_25610 [Blastocatellia bacterium]|nr:hypothetical protein [Blastocatellia bacterium]
MKVQAKAANKIVNSRTDLGGICDLAVGDMESALESLPVGKIWGIGPRRAPLLKEHGIITAIVVHSGFRFDHLGAGQSDFSLVCKIETASSTTSRRITPIRRNFTINQGLSTSSNIRANIFYMYLSGYCARHVNGHPEECTQVCFEWDPSSNHNYCIRKTHFQVHASLSLQLE